MTDRDPEPLPVPLKAGGEAAPELVRALVALRGVRPDAMRRARISERLSIRLAFVPDPPARGRTMLVPGTAIATALVAMSWLAYHLAR
jgi:hypothetical protein